MDLLFVNGSLAYEFSLEGLRQDGPNSPFLFLIVVEGLNVMKNTNVDI